MRPNPVHPKSAGPGFSLLEVMIALMILGLVATGFLQMFTGALRALADTRTWAQALVYAEEAQETLKIEGLPSAAGADTVLAGGFHRRLELQPWRDGIARATVIVTFPDGGSFSLDRLVPAP